MYFVFNMQFYILNTFLKLYGFSNHSQENRHWLACMHHIYICVAIRMRVRSYQHAIIKSSPNLTIYINERKKKEPFPYGRASSVVPIKFIINKGKNVYIQNKNAIIHTCERARTTRIPTPPNISIYIREPLNWNYTAIIYFCFNSALLCWHTHNPQRNICNKKSVTLCRFYQAAAFTIALCSALLPYIHSFSSRAYTRNL